MSGEAGRREGEIHSRGGLSTSAQESQSSVLWGKKAVSFTLLQNDPAGSTLGREGRWGSSVQNSCWDISEYLLLEDFFFFFYSKGRGCWEGFRFYLFVRLRMTLFVPWCMKVLQLWEIAFCLIVTRKQLSSHRVSGSWLRFVIRGNVSAFHFELGWLFFCQERPFLRA